MKLDNRALKLRGKLFQEYLQHDYRSTDRKKELDADTPGSDWVIVYSYDDNNSDWLAVTQSNYEYFMKRLGSDHTLDEWKYSNQRILWANVAIPDVWYEVEDLHYALDRHYDLDGTRSAELQWGMDIQFIEENKPKYLLETPPDDWAESVLHWIQENGSGEFDYRRIGEACYQLGLMSGGYCPKGHVHFRSTEENHWTWFVTIDESAAAHDRYDQWVQEENGAMLTKVLPGFLGTHVPYPGQYNEEWDEDVIDRIDGKYICPKCGAIMEDKE